MVVAVTVGIRYNNDHTNTNWLKRLLSRISSALGWVDYFEVGAFLI
ncbi:hypothetical protein HMPREF0495_00988 [Levilactobacillus brevis ATCC 14869 = DSM 20054]|uniref:Uncharacterized protein n=1 Tax=Levilactobacillus brevis ATCC 14869 = DSM 20054 TaxID=649758 RepID=U2PKN8_LEVBR|nr:hypothetical protein HMPREF0495_00988 [Levilactobacillus brevis ATCC 14869 = DSM 20054]KIO98440.1 Na(+)/H(+) antiporter [Levilactobacillus brevis]